MLEGTGVAQLLRNATMKEPEWWRQALDIGATKAGINVTTDTAMQVSAVFACVRILAESIGSLPLILYERDSDGGKRPAERHPLYLLLKALPNEEMTSQELLEFLVASLNLWGTAYSLVERRMGRIVRIQPLHSRYMRPERTADGQLRYDYQEPGNSRVYQPADIWRIPGLTFNGVTGLSPIGQARESIGASVAMERHGARTFANGAAPTGVFEHPGQLSDEAYERLKKDLEERYAGADNAGKTLILEGGLKFTPIGMKLEDAQFLQSRKFQIAEIARWFRVPLHLLAELDKATFSNIEHQSIEFVVHTLRPWAKRIESTIVRDLLTETERLRLFAEFKLDALLRGDVKTRHEAYGTAIKDGWMTRNEVRLLENLNPEPGLDEFLVPLNMGSATEQDMAAARNLVSREVRAIRVEAQRLEGEQLLAWAADFYGRHAEELRKTGISESRAAIYVQTHLAVLQHVRDLESVLKHWERTAPLELVA